MSKPFSPSESDAPPTSAVRSGKGIKVTIITTINATPAELFSFWRNFENLPRVMHHLESVTVSSHSRSRWQTRASGDKHFVWEVAIVNERRDEMIAWRSVEEGEMRHAGSIWFTPAPGNVGTEVKLTIEYEGGKLTNGLKKMWRHAPEQQLREDLRHLKQWMETGEIPTTAGQSAGRPAAVEQKYEEAK